MNKRTIGLALFVLAAAVSCQRPLEGSPCPCVSGYQCCEAEQACYPESARCPGVPPGTLAWMASGVPSVDKVGNIYVDDENGAQLHAISLLDKETGRPRWTETGASALRCSTAEVAVFERHPDWQDPSTNAPPQLFGVSTSDGERRWSAPISGVSSCSDTGEQAYVVDSSSSTDTVVKAYATRNGAVVRSGRVDGRPYGTYLIGIRDNLALVEWGTESETTVQALDVPEGGTASIRWTARLPGPLTSFSFEDAGRILAMTGDGADGGALVRLAASNGGIVWRHAVTGAGDSTVNNSWPGIVLVHEGEALVAVGEETGAVLWAFSLAGGEGYGLGRLAVVHSGNMLISYDQLTTTAGATSTLYELLGADGNVRWTFGPVPGALQPLAADEYYLRHDGVLSRVDPRTGTYVWRYPFAEGLTYYPRGLIGSDVEQLFVSVGSNSESECPSTSICYQKLLVLARRDGSVAWETGWFAPQNINGPLSHVFADDATHVHAFTQTPGPLLTGTVWAFWR